MASISKEQLCEKKNDQLVSILLANRKDDRQMVPFHQLGCKVKVGIGSTSPQAE